MFKRITSKFQKKAKLCNKTEQVKDKANTLNKESNGKKRSWDISDYHVDPEDGKTRFHDLDLHDKLMQSIHHLLSLIHI